GNVSAPISDTDCVTIRYRARDTRGTDATAGTDYILNNKRLPEEPSHVLSENARDGVRWTASREWHDDRDRPRRIGLRPRDPRHQRERGSALGEMQKFAAGKFHFEPPSPSHHSITSSARARSVGGISRPSALAVVRLTTSSNLVGCSTGRSAGFAPRRILSTNSAARRNRS